MSHPRNRAQTTALINTCWYIGSIIAAWTTFGALNIAGSWSWRLCCLIQVVPCAVQLVGLWFTEESPRWLISKGQEERALRVLAKYHANGDEQDELVQFEFEEIKEAIAAEKKANASVSVWTFTKTRGNKHRLLILIVSTSSISSVAGNSADYRVVCRLLLSMGRQRYHLLLPRQDPHLGRNHRPHRSGWLQRRSSDLQLVHGYRRIPRH